MNPRVTTVQAENNGVLLLEFSNNEKRKYDCSPYFHFGVFSELKDERYFKSVKVENGTVTWENGQDICPDTLYLDSVAV